MRENIEIKRKFRKLTKHQETCLYCGAKFKKNVRSSVDHIYPLCIYGQHANKLENFAKICSKCNSDKSGHDPLEWLQSRGLVTKKLLKLLDIAYKSVCKNL